MSSCNIVALDVNGQQLELSWGDLGQQLGLSQGDLLYKEVAALTGRVITALQTDKAISGFSKLSEMWKLKHGANFDVGKSVEYFQGLLKTDITQPNLRPTIAVDLGLPDGVDAEFKSPKDSEKPFHIGEQRIP